MGDPAALDPNTLAGAVVAVLGVIGCAVVWGVRQIVGSAVGRKLLAAWMSDVERREDGSYAAKPDTDSEALADAIATRVQERQAPELGRLSDGLDAVRAEQTAARQREDAALEREEQRSRRIDRLELATEGRLSRIEGRLGVVPTPVDDTEDAPAVADGGRR